MLKGRDRSVEVLYRMARDGARRSRADTERMRVEAHDKARNAEGGNRRAEDMEY